MSKKTNAQQEKETIAQLPQQLSELDRYEFEELYRIANTYALIARMIKGNTALIPEGQRVAGEYEAISRLMENVKDQRVAQMLASMGYPKGSKVKIDVRRGVIIPLKDDES